MGKAKKARKKAAGLLKRAAEQASKESAQKAKAKSASNDALKRALAHRKHAKSDLKKAHEEVARARGHKRRAHKGGSTHKASKGGVAKAKALKRKASNALFAAKPKTEARKAQKQL